MKYDWVKDYIEYMKGKGIEFESLTRQVLYEIQDANISELDGHKFIAHVVENSNPNSIGMKLARREIEIPTLIAKNGDNFDITFNGNVILKSPTTEINSICTNDVSNKTIGFRSGNDFIYVRFYGVNSDQIIQIDIYANVVNSGFVMEPISNLLPDYHNEYHIGLNNQIGNCNKNVMEISNILRPKGMSDFNYLKLIGKTEQLKYHNSVDIEPKSYSR